MGKEETYKDKLQREGRDEDLFAPKKREPRGLVPTEHRAHPGEAEAEAEPEPVAEAKSVAEAEPVPKQEVSQERRRAA